jgi:hypothetical protein
MLGPFDENMDRLRCHAICHDLEFAWILSATKRTAKIAPALLRPQAIDKGQPYHAEVDVLFREDGSSFPVELWTRPIQRGNVPIGAVVTYRHHRAPAGAGDFCAMPRKRPSKAAAPRAPRRSRRESSVVADADAPIHPPLHILVAEDNLTVLTASGASRRVCTAISPNP